MKVTEDTKAVAQKILDYFTMYPERHEQDSWIDAMDRDNVNNIFDYDRANIVDEQNICQTTMCVAGTAVWVTEGIRGINECLSRNNSKNFDDMGSSLLGLDDDEAEWLFMESSNEQAKDAVVALAQGDRIKFSSIMTRAREDY